MKHKQSLKHEKKQFSNETFNSQLNLSSSILTNQKQQQITFGDEVVEKGDVRFGEDYRRQLLDQNNSTSFLKIHKQIQQSIDLEDIDRMSSSNTQNNIEDKRNNMPKQKKRYIHNGQLCKTSSSFQKKFMSQRQQINKQQDDNDNFRYSNEIKNIQEIQDMENEEDDEDEEDDDYNQEQSNGKGENSLIYPNNQQNFLGVHSINKLDLQEEESPQFQVKEIFDQGIQKQSIWLRNFFPIIGYIGKFKYHLKKQLIFRNPDLLQKNQIMMIDDKGAKGIEEMDLSKSRNDVNVYKGSNFNRYYYLRKLRKKILIARKKLKVIWSPVQKCFISLGFIIKKAFMSLNIPLFSPVSPMIMLWDIINISLIFILTLYITFNIAYENHVQNLEFELVTELVFMINIFVQCNLSYYEKGIQINSRKAILAHFFKNDFLSEILALISIFMPNGNPIQLLFFFKFPQFHNVINKYKENNQFNLKLNLTFSIFILLIEVIQFCHFFSCIWYTIGKYDLEHSQNSEPIKSWLADMNLQNIKQIYIASLYFCVISVTSIGYGDIYAKTDNERIFAIFMALIASGIFGYTVNRMNTILDEYYKLKNQFRLQLRDINYYMNSREVSNKIQNRQKILLYLNIKFCNYFTIYNQFYFLYYSIIKQFFN